MFRILVVDDELDEKEELVNRIKEEISEAYLDEADNVEEATRMIEGANASQHPYDAAVLDFKLPMTGAPDSPMEMNESLCLACRENFKTRTYIIHCTGNRGHPDIDKHLAMYHSSPEAPPANTVFKRYIPGEYDYTQEVAQLLKTYLYSQKVKRELHAIFGSSLEGEAQSEPTAFDQSRFVPPGASLSDRLMLLTDEITLYWNDLDEATQRDVRREFYVDASMSPVLVSLLSPASGKDVEG